jgi:hypothetical protein
MQEQKKLIITDDSKPKPKAKTPPKADAGFDVKRLLDGDNCPCGSDKAFRDCCRVPFQEGWTEVNTVHLLFTVPSEIIGGLPSYALQTAKLSGAVPPDDVVWNIRKRIHSTPIQATIRRLPRIVEQKNRERLSELATR